MTVAEQRRSLGNETVTSAEFASALGITPQLVRRDLLSLGHFGIPHVGFRIDKCVESLRHALNLESVRNIVWVGVDSPVPPDRFIDRMESFGCRVVAILDARGEPAASERTIGNVRVFNFDAVGRIVKNLAVVGAIIACDIEKVQFASNTLIRLGIASILNLTPVLIDHPVDVFVQNMDPSEDIMLFSFHCRGH